MRWRLRLSEPEFSGMHRAGIKSQGADTLLQLETNGMHTTDLDDDLQEMMVSLIRQVAKINDGHDGKSSLLFVCQQCDGTV